MPNSPSSTLAVLERDEPQADERPAPTPARKVARGRRLAMWPRRALVRVHRWVSFVLLAWLVVVSLTGAWLVFNDGLEAQLNGERFATTDGDVGAQAAMDAVAPELPADGYVYYVALPDTARGVYQVYTAWPDPDAPPPASEDEYPAEIYATYFVDPGSGEINDRTLDEEGFTWWMYRGHLYLWQDHGIFGVFDAQDGWCRAGGDGQEPGGVHGVVCDVIPDGEDTVAYFGLGWIVVLLTGFYLWYWPGVRRWATAFRIQRGRGPFTFNLSLHKVIGFVVWVPLLVITFTGVAFAFPNMKAWFQNVTPAARGAELWIPPEDALSEPVDGVEAMDVDAFLADLEQQFPERRVASIANVPADETGTWQAWVSRGFDPWTREAGVGNTLVVMDQYSGEVLYDGTPEEGNSFDQAWDDWSFPLHAGDFGGTITRVLWTLVAFSPLVLGGTGVTMWLIRRQKRRRRRPSTTAAG